MTNKGKKYRYKKFKRKALFKRRVISLAIVATAVFLSTNKVLSLTSSTKLNRVDINEIVATENKTISEEKPTPPKATDIIRGSNVTYEGQKYAIPAEEVEGFINGESIDNKKYVFLTFDDGPSPNTEKVLEILKEKDAKATFFVIGRNLEGNDYSAQLLKRAITEGNAIANHSYTHNTSKLYPNNSININYFMEEFNSTNNLIKNILGNNFNTRVLRMPGGYGSRKYYNDPSLTAFDLGLKENNIVSIDWNAINRDAEGKDYSSAEMLEHAKETSDGQNKVVILMHDTYGKEKTVQILPELIDYYKSQGYEFKTIQS